MAKITKVKIGGGIYYYLEQSIRRGNKVSKKRIYLGKTIPSNVSELRNRFMKEMYAEEWYPAFDRIKKGYLAGLKRLPVIARDKEIEVFMIEFTYDTQRIEGSKLSFRDTAQVLLEQTAPKGAHIHDIKEAEAHRRVFYEMLEYDRDLSLGIILKWHKELFEETKKTMAGEIRNFNVRITNSKFIPPNYVYMESMLGNFFAWYNKHKKEVHPVELAALAHLKFVTIHPFADGNGRISRLIMNFILNKNRYPMLNIRYVNRRGYYTALERSQLKNDEGIFLIWFFRKYLKENKRYIPS